jgi:CRP-like cAMP-binding protein
VYDIEHMAFRRRKEGLMAATQRKKTDSFNLEKYLNTIGIARTMVNYKKGDILFSQGDQSQSVLYLQRGIVKLTVISSGGKEAVIALLYPRDFLGEGCLAGQPLRVATATAVAPASVLVIEKQEMIRVVHEEHQFSDRFIAYVLKRNIRVEEDLADQLFNSSEKRLARVLLLIAKYGKEEQPETIIAKISHETLSEMIGTTRSRVNFFMNKFQRLGYINYSHGLHINSSLLRVVLDDPRTLRSTPAA